MAKSFKARKKARNDKKRNPRIDSTAAVVLPADGTSQPPPSSELEASTTSIPPSSIDSEPPPSSEASEAEGVDSSEVTVGAASEPPAAEAARATDEPVALPAVEPEEALAAEPEKKRADDSGQFHAEFFAKSEDEIHHEEARREAPDLHDPEVAAPVVRRRPVDRRAQKFVAAFVGFFALLGLAGAVMRKGTPRPAAAAAAVATEAPRPVETMAVQPPAAVMTNAPELPAVPAAPPAPAPTPSETVAAAPSAAPSSTAPAPAPTPEPAAAAAPSATIAAAVAPSAAPAPAADDEDSLTGSQLLAKARQAINSNNASKAAALAKKAISKGAGGSAYYVLGAAYQTMGSNGAAKSAYGSCAKSGCPEAGECASLVEGM